jgi:hypothetical protein
MVTYPPEQVAPIAQAQARLVLTKRGLPDAHVTSFRPAQTLVPLERDPRFLVIGYWSMDAIPIAVSVDDATVVSATPWRDGVDLVNTSLVAFVDSLDAITSAAPLSSRNPSYPDLDAAAAYVHDALARIDPPALEDPDGHWQTIVDDIANGDYDDRRSPSP